MEKFKTVLEQLSQYPNALCCGVVILLTVGGEKIFSTVVFQCPCSAKCNLPYGLVFLVVPALILFPVGNALRTLTRRLLTGCCSQSVSGSSSSKLDEAQVCLQISWTAVIASLTWVAVALLGGSFYECAFSGSTLMAMRLCKDHDPSCVDKLPQVPCKQEAEMQDILSQLKAQSQMLGWALIAAVIILPLIVKSIKQCTSPISYLQLQSWKIFSEKEEQILQSQATEHATQSAKENVRYSFKCNDLKECKTTSRKAREQISALYTRNSHNQVCSMLHKYVNRKMEDDSVRLSEAEETVFVDLVDDAGMSNTHKV